MATELETQILLELRAFKEDVDRKLEDIETKLDHNTEDINKAKGGWLIFKWIFQVSIALASAVGLASWLQKGGG